MFKFSKPIVWLVGNKIDLKERRMVSRWKAEEKARELEYIYFETSAKTGENVDILLKSVLKTLLKARLNEIKLALGI